MLHTVQYTRICRQHNSKYILPQEKRINFTKSSYFIQSLYMLLDMLDHVPKLTEAIESIATHRQCFEEQGSVLCQAGGGSHTHTHDPFHHNTHHIPEDGRCSDRLQI